MSAFTALTYDLPPNPDHNPALDPRAGTLIPSPRLSHTHAMVPYPFDPNNLFGKGLFYLPEYVVGNRPAVVASQRLVVVEMTKLQEDEEHRKRVGSLLEVEVKGLERADLKKNRIWRRKLGWARAEDRHMRKQRFRCSASFRVTRKLLVGYDDRYVWDHELGQWTSPTTSKVERDLREWLCSEFERIDEMRYRVEDEWISENRGERNSQPPATRKRKRKPEMSLQLDECMKKPKLEVDEDEGKEDIHEGGETQGSPNIDGNFESSGYYEDEAESEQTESEDSTIVLNHGWTRKEVELTGDIGKTNNDVLAQRDRS